MVSMVFENTGWLNRYLSYRAATPFVLSEEYRKLAEGKNGEEIFDDFLYKEVKENGILLGCPVITESLAEMAEELDFPQQRGGTNHSTDKYQLRLLNILLLVLKYHFPQSYYRIPKEVPLPELLVQNESLNGVLTKLEESLIDAVTLPGYSSLGNRQNIFAFSKLYFFLLWAREGWKNPYGMILVSVYLNQ